MYTEDLRAEVVGCADGKSQGESAWGGDGAGYMLTRATNISETRGHGEAFPTVPGEALTLVPFWEQTT